jgi:hypothetical protein
MAGDAAMWMSMTHQTGIAVAATPENVPPGFVGRRVVAGRRGLGCAAVAPVDNRGADRDPQARRLRRQPNLEATEFVFRQIG